MTYYKNLIGKKFNHLTVLDLAEGRDSTCRKWVCKCDCGNIKIIRSSHLLSGNTKSCGKCIKRLPYGVSSMRQKIASYKGGAKRRNLEYSISDSDFYQITQSNCYYCNSKPSNKADKPCSYGEYIYNGLDRINSLKGYTIENVVPCCFKCNQAKSDMTQEEFKNWLNKIYHHYISLPTNT